MRDRPLRSLVAGVAAGILVGMGALALVAASRPASADDAKPAGPAPGGPATAAEPARRRALTDKEKAELLPLLHAYLDAESPMAFRDRIALIEAAKKAKEAGCDVLADVDALRNVLYQARPFLPPFEKKPKDAGKDYEIRVDNASGVTSVRWDQLRLGISVPKAYVDARDQKKLNVTPPFPMIVVLHNADDYEDKKAAKPWPGEEAIKRLYPKALMKAVTDQWIVYAPVAPKAKFTDAEAVTADKIPSVLSERIPLAQIWRRYQVDFNRIVIDGGPDALLFAAAYPIWYAGAIVRGDATDVSPDIVPNLASTYVYVVQTGEKVPPVYETLKKAGHPEDKLKMGPPTAMADWLASVKRVTPKAFKWAVKDKNAQRLAQWINIDVIDEAAPLPTLDVEIVDTKDDPNTVRINAVGIRGITIFLNDALVDLDREVRVVINGKMLEECTVESSKPQGTPVRLPWKFVRTIDGMFDRKTVSIRKSMFYGWLFPVALEQVKIEGDYKPEEPADPAQTQHETAAKTYFEKAEVEKVAGNFAKARALYQRCIDEGETSYKAKAEAAMKAIEGK